MTGTTPFADRPWLHAYPEGVPAEIPEVDLALPDMIEATVERFGRRPALEFFGARTTYAELGDAIDRAAEGLRRLGVRAGDPVAILLPNCPQHVVAFYAVLRIGAIVVEHNPLYTPRELGELFADHGAKTAISWDALADTLAELPREHRPTRIVAVDLTRAMPWKLRMLLRLPLRKARETRAQLTSTPRRARTIAWERLVDGRRIRRRAPRPGLDDTALLQYTSGTTGRPKAAMLTHRNLQANAMQGRAWVPGLHEGEEVFYGVLPLFHAYGMTLCLTFAMQIGAMLVLFPKFDLELLLKAARTSPPTFLPAVPPIYDRLCRAAAEGRIDLRSIRFALSGAMSLPVSTVERWEELSGGLLVEGYGMTETSPVAVGNPMGPARRPGTVGVPFPSTDIRVIDPDHPERDLGPGETGELLLRGPQVFGGYWNRPEETAATLLDGGWIRTGDLVTVSDDGFVTVVDRLKELIITGGFNVAPSEVEEALVAHPDLDDAAVVGLPRGDGGEDVVAAVVARPGAVVEPEALRDYCRTRLTGYKVPRRIVLVDELPRSLVGKVVRREVRELLLRLEAGGE